MPQLDSGRARRRHAASLPPPGSLASYARVLALALALALPAGAPGVSGLASAQEPAQPPEALRRLQQMSPEQLQQLMRRHAEASMPGAEHERLGRLAGSWRVHTQVWPQPGAEPITIPGRARAEMILGGRFLSLHLDSGAGEDAAQAVHVIGFDRRAGEYTILALDTTGTYWVSARGAAGAEESRIVMSGSDYDPIFEQEQLYDMVLTMTDEDHFTFEVVFKDPMHTRGGPPFRMVEASFTRAAEAGS